MSAHMTERTCKWCKTEFMARTADVNRGWALFCSKSCKASRQEKLTGQNRDHQSSQRTVDGVVDNAAMHDDDMHEAAMDGISDADWGASDGG